MGIGEQTKMKTSCSIILWSFLIFKILMSLSTAHLDFIRVFNFLEAFSLFFILREKKSWKKIMKIFPKNFFYKISKKLFWKSLKKLWELKSWFFITKILDFFCFKREKNIFAKFSLQMEKKNEKNLFSLKWENSFWDNSLSE